MKVRQKTKLFLVIYHLMYNVVLPVTAQWAGTPLHEPVSSIIFLNFFLAYLCHNSICAYTVLYE